jgi:hypothetical protein
MSQQNFFFVAAQIFVQIRLGSFSIPSQNGWTQFEKNSYLLQSFNSGFDWDAAEARCVKLGGHLASIHSKAENLFIARRFAGKFKII